MLSFIPSLLIIGVDLKQQILVGRLIVHHRPPSGVTCETVGTYSLISFIYSYHKYFSSSSFACTIPGKRLF